MSVTRLARRKAFQCLHRYDVRDWSAAKNREIFGACFTPNGHGHNYELEVYLEGPVASDSGMVANLADVDRWLDQVLAPLNGRHLNREVPAFKNRVPTTEAVALYLTEELQRSLKFEHVKLAKVRLYEYDDLWVDVWP